MEWHPASNVLLAGSAGGLVTFWKIPSGECKILPSFGVSTQCGKVMPDGKPKHVKSS
jgi:ribosome assembly protein SQT1